jgi:hypothetical protein
MVWLRAIGLQDTMYIRKLLTLNMDVSFRTSQSKADKSALIDSGTTDNFCYRPLDPGTSPPRSTGISAARTTRWSWMTLSNGKIGLALLVYASPDVDGLHESPCDSAPMYVTRSPVSSCSVPCAQYPVPCTRSSISTTL